MNHCLISNFRLSEGLYFHFRFAISTSGQTLACEWWGVFRCNVESELLWPCIWDDSSSFDHHRSFLWLLFSLLDLLVHPKKGMSMSHSSIMGSHEIGKCRLKNRKFWKIFAEKSEVWISNFELVNKKISSFSIFPTELSNFKLAPWWIPGITVGTFVELEIGLLTNLDEFPQQVIIHMIFYII